MNIREIKERVIARSKNSLANFVDLKRQSFRVIDLFEIGNYLGNQNLFQELLRKGKIALDFLNNKTVLKPTLSILTDYETDKIYEKNNGIDVNDDINKYILWRKNEIYQQLRKLNKTDAESRRETGISHLKIGFPFVSGSYYDESNKLDYYRGPLFFFNVTFEQLTNKFNINWDRNINPNINLLSKLGYFLKIDLTAEFEQLESEEDDNNSVFEILKKKYDLMLKIFREKLDIDIPNLEFMEEFEVIKFPFKSESLTTLRKKAKTIEPSLVYSALIGFYKTESAELIHDLDNWENSEEYFTELENQFCNKDVVDKNYNPIKSTGKIVQISELDFSQKLAISSALQKNLVINGPPGTGKSQTIVNLLINILNNKKKALFCAEKRVATEVVYNRLKYFQTFALLIYDLKNDKKSFIKQLQKSYFSLKIWSSQVVQSTGDISTKINDLLNQISNFHDVLATEDAQKYISDLTKYSGKVADEIIAKVQHYNIFNNILLNNFDEQYQKIKTSLQASDYYEHILSNSKIIKNFVIFKKVVNFNWNNVSEQEAVIVQYYLTNKLKSKVSFWNKRKVTKYYNSNILKSEFELFDELLNKYHYLGREWINNYSASFHNEIKDILNILKTNALALKDLIKCISLKKFENKYLNVFKLEEIDWKSEYKKLIKEKEKLDLKNLHIQFAKEIMFKIDELKQEHPKLYAKFDRLITGKRLPTLKKIMESYRVFISEIFPIIISSIEGGITLFPNKRGSIDYMIFDEASQIFLERGISLMNRGQKVIIAGDGKQLQPSNFFAKNLDDYDEEEDDVDEFKASEYSSLLEFGSTFFSKEMLNYHYRSESRELIEFSNKIFYEGKLLVCEKPHQKQKAIEVRNVDGKWINQRNEIEANAVVEEILHILDNRKNNETIGVVAFNKEQAKLILEKLEKLADPIVEWEMNGKSDVNKCLFVKNLEEVQGDERDIIIFSVAFAKDIVTNRLKRNFGPINKTNGENRINVAVSRAVKKIIVVKSIRGNDFGYDISTLKEGAKVFADYINYVDHLQLNNLDNEIFQSIWSKYLIEYSADNHYQQMDSILEEEIYTQLKKHLNEERFDIIPQVKQSGFRIDLGIKDKATGNFVLAIECDGHTYHSKPMDRARDIWRQSILESNGWKFERISSLQWWKGNQNQIIERVLKKIKTLS